MSRKFIEETVDRINSIMQSNTGAKTYLDLSIQDNRESMELVTRINDIADAAEKCRSETLPDEQRRLCAFAEALKAEDIALFKHYFVWFRGLSVKDRK